jgi:glycosyltransferase involved in cell wall biosynthesis
LVYLGEICEQDGVDHLVRALQILRDERGRTDVSCVFVGGGPHQPAVKEYAHTLGVSEMCTFTGRVSDEDLSVILSTADIGVDPDPKNDWSDKSTMNKVMEYMFFALPVVAYDLAETRVSADGAAAYAEPNSERSLAAEIDTLLRDPERMRLMGATGRDRVLSELAWEFSAPVLLDAYERLAPSAPRLHHV